MNLCGDIVYIIDNYTHWERYPPEMAVPFLFVLTG